MHRPHHLQEGRERIDSHNRLTFVGSVFSGSKLLFALESDCPHFAISQTSASLIAYNVNSTVYTPMLIISLSIHDIIHTSCDENSHPDHSSQMCFTSATVVAISR